MSLPNGAKNNRLDPVLAIALKITHPIQVVKDNFLVIFPSSCSQFFVLSSTQTHEPSAAEFKIGGKRR
jgi:hypothetical protein